MMYSVIEVLPVKESNDHPLQQKRVVSRPAEGWCRVQRAYPGQLSCMIGCVEDSRQWLVSGYTWVVQDSSVQTTLCIPHE